MTLVPWSASTHFRSCFILQMRLTDGVDSITASVRCIWRACAVTSANPKRIIGLPTSAEDTVPAKENMCALKKSDIRATDGAVLHWMVWGEKMKEEKEEREGRWVRRKGKRGKKKIIKKRKEEKKDEREGGKGRKKVREKEEGGIRKMEEEKEGKREGKGRGEGRWERRKRKKRKKKREKEREGEKEKGKKEEEREGRMRRRSRRTSGGISFLHFFRWLNLRLVRIISICRMDSCQVALYEWYVILCRSMWRQFCSGSGCERRWRKSEHGRKWCHRMWRRLHQHDVMSRFRLEPGEQRMLPTATWRRVHQLQRLWRRPLQPHQKHQPLHRSADLLTPWVTWLAHAWSASYLINQLDLWSVIQPYLFMYYLSIFTKDVYNYT